MKTVIKISALLAALAGGGIARGEGGLSGTRSLLADFFPESRKVTYQVVALTPPLKARLAARLGYAPPKDRYTVFVATTGDRVDGYAIIDEEPGEHQPITFATKLSPRGVVERLEIMVYREPRGDEVRDARFRRQFVGKTARDPFRLHQDIDAVSGATISSASMAVGVRRAAVLLEETLLARPGSPPAASAGTASGAICAR